jgi:hypothetical protein
MRISYPLSLLQMHRNRREERCQRIPRRVPLLGPDDEILKSLPSAIDSIIYIYIYAEVDEAVGEA